MKDKVNSKFLKLILLIFLIPTRTALATESTTSAELKNLRVISHHFTTTISNRNKMIYVKEPSNARYVVIKFSATLQQGGKVFSDDFVLKYFHADGKEDRSSCEALAPAITDEPDEFDEFYSGSGAWIKLDVGQVYFGLAFFIENDVTSIEIYRIGKAEPFTYNFGSTDRAYSVFISTNLGSQILATAVDVVLRGGYYVKTSKELDTEKTDTTIFYREITESQAREISQRLIAKMGIIPTLEKMELISEFDVVVWIGK